jgi:hypothetical protein
LRVFAIFATFAALTATAASAHTAKLRPDVIAYWQGPLHNCEQPSGWHGGFPRYPGGLGIYEPNWRSAARELGLLRRYPNGASAPILVQVRVADYGYRAHRWYWSCFASVGYPPR